MFHNHDGFPFMGDRTFHYISVHQASLFLYTFPRIRLNGIKFK